MAEYYNCEKCNEINPKGWGKQQKCKKCKAVQGQRSTATELVKEVVLALQEIRQALETQNQLIDYIAGNLSPLAPPEITEEETKKK